MRPVTTMQTQTVDQGGYVAQQVINPGQTSYSLNYARDALGNNSGLIWAPQTTPATVQTQYSYRPNLVTQQVAKTSYVPQVQQVQVPVQVQTMQSEVVSQQVPIQVQRMQTQMVTQKVPIQTTRMVATTEVRKVPYTVQRPITETITRKVPVQQQRWVSEERVRKVPVQTTRTVYETRKEPIEVKYYEQEAFTRTVDEACHTSKVRSLHRNCHGTETGCATCPSVLHRSVWGRSGQRLLIIFESSDASRNPCCSNPQEWCRIPGQLNSSTKPHSCTGSKQYA